MSILQIEYSINRIVEGVPPDAVVESMLTEAILGIDFSKFEELAGNVVALVKQPEKLKKLLLSQGINTIDDLVSKLDDMMQYFKGIADQKAGQQQTLGTESIAYPKDSVVFCEDWDAFMSSLKAAGGMLKDVSVMAAKKLASMLWSLVRSMLSYIGDIALGSIKFAYKHFVKDLLIACAIVAIGAAGIMALFDVGASAIIVAYVATVIYWLLYSLKKVVLMVLSSIEGSQMPRMTMIGDFFDMFSAALSSRSYSKSYHAGGAPSFT